MKITGKERLERLYKMLKKNYPQADIRFSDETLIIGEYTLVKYQVAYFAKIGDKDTQICDVIWGYGSYGYEHNLLEFYNGGEPEGHIDEIRAYELFKAEIEA